MGFERLVVVCGLRVCCGNILVDWFPVCFDV